MQNLEMRDQAAKFRIASLLWMAGISLLARSHGDVHRRADIEMVFARPAASGTRRSARSFPGYAHGSGIFAILVGVILFAPAMPMARASTWRRWRSERGAVATLAKMLSCVPVPIR